MSEAGGAINQEPKVERFTNNDRLARVYRGVLERLKNEPGNGTVISIEYFQGNIRTDLGAEDQKAVIVCSTFEQAQRLKKDADAKNEEGDGKVMFVVADALKSAPFVEGAGNVVDPHRASYVGDEKVRYPSVLKRLGQFVTEARRLVQGAEAIARPVYFDGEQHREMKTEFAGVIKDRARITSENGIVCFSVATRREETPVEEGYFAEHHREGQIDLSLSEIKQILAEAGFEIAPDGLYGGMAAKSQLIATESSAKTVIFTILGKKSEDFINEKIIGTAHTVVENLFGFLGKNKKKVAPVLPSEMSGVGELKPYEVDENNVPKDKNFFPDRFIVIARKIGSSASGDYRQVPREVLPGKVDVTPTDVIFQASDGAAVNVKGNPLANVEIPIHEVAAVAERAVGKLDSGLQVVGGVGDLVEQKLNELAGTNK